MTLQFLDFLCFLVWCVCSPVPRKCQLCVVHIPDCTTSFWFLQSHRPVSRLSSNHPVSRLRSNHPVSRVSSGHPGCPGTSGNIPDNFVDGLQKRPTETDDTTQIPLCFSSSSNHLKALLSPLFVTSECGPSYHLYYHGLGGSRKVVKLRKDRIGIWVLRGFYLRFRISIRSLGIKFRLLWYIFRNKIIDIY